MSLRVQAEVFPGSLGYGCFFKEPKWAKASPTWEMMRLPEEVKNDSPCGLHVVHKAADGEEDASRT